MIITRKLKRKWNDKDKDEKPNSLKKIPQNQNAISDKLLEEKSITSSDMLFTHPARVRKLLSNNETCIKQTWKIRNVYKFLKRSRA